MQCARCYSKCNRFNTYVLLYVKIYSLFAAYALKTQRRKPILYTVTISMTNGLIGPIISFYQFRHFF